MCRTCESENREIWTYLNLPNLPDIKVANWVSLEQCHDCETLWCEIPYEPYASFKFLVKWPYTLEDFNSISKIEDSLILHEWHGSFIRENWQSLSRKEVAAINTWRERTYMNHNPIDRNSAEHPAKYILCADDIRQYV